MSCAGSHEKPVGAGLRSAAVVERRGRKPGRALSDLEVRYLRLLLDLRVRGKAGLADVDERIEDFVLELRDAGASARGIAEQLGVGPSTVQGWTKNARRRRESSR
jgi:hypothetical protein